MKALSLRFAGCTSASVSIVQVAPEASQAAIGSMGIEKTPAMALFSSQNENAAEPQLFDGDLKELAEMVAWVETAAGNEYGSGEELEVDEEWLTTASWKSVVESGNDAWVIAFLPSKNEEEFVKGEEWTKAESDCTKLGAIRCAKVDCSDALALPQCTDATEPTIMYRGFGEAGANAEEHGTYALHEADDVEDAMDLAIQSLPDRVFPVSMANMMALDSFIMQTFNDKKTPFLLLTKKTETPDMYTALAAKIGSEEGDCTFAIFYQPDEATIERFQIRGKLPQLMSFIPQAPTADMGEVPEGMSGQAFGLLPYDRRQLGPLSFESMGVFATSVAAQYGLKKDPSEAAAGKPEAFTSNPDVPAVYLTPENFVEQCVNKGLCVIGMVDGDAARGPDLQKELDVLEGVRKTARKRGDPFHFTLLDASCQHEFAEWFDVQPAKLPTVVALSPRKLRYVTMIMPFGEDGILNFLTGVKSGRISTGPIGDIPTPKEVDCAAAHEEVRALEAAMGGDEDDGDMEDMMAEILAEEAREREALAAKIKEEQERKKQEMAEKKQREEDEKKRVVEEEAAAAKKKKKKKSEL
jgi:hypothetical protein